MMAYAPLRLEDYDISSTNGFLPTKPPLKRLLDPYYEPWEQIMDRFNQYLLAHHIRPLVRKVSKMTQYFGYSFLIKAHPNCVFGGEGRRHSDNAIGT